MAHAGALLAARDVSYAYGRRSPRVIEGVSLDVSRGSIVGLLGPNGSGKTTLLRLLAGTMTPIAGRVAISGVPVSSLSRRDLARRIAVVPQETYAAFDFTVLEIVLMGRYPHLGAFALEGPSDLAIAREALDATGTAALEGRQFNRLSGGEKQRVVIASALAQAADALLLDEPTASLDLAYQLDVVDLLRRLNRDRGTTMVVSSHDLNLVSALCTELVMLRGGRIIACGQTPDVLTAANVRALYGVEVQIARHPTADRVLVVPIGRAD